MYTRKQRQVSRESLQLMMDDCLEEIKNDFVNEIFDKIRTGNSK